MESRSYYQVLPQLMICKVVQQDFVNHRLWICTPSGQITNVGAKVGGEGPIDAYRVRQTSLPLPGTWGLVAFPSKDGAGAIWVRAIYPSNSFNAYTSSSTTPASGDAYLEYFSHFSGYYEWLDYLGNSFQRFPDGTTLTINASGQAPTIYRHEVQEVPASPEGGTTLSVVPVQVTDAERTPNPPSQPFYVKLSHASGTVLEILPNGNILTNCVGSVTNYVCGSVTNTVSGSVSSNITGTSTLTASGAVTVESVNGDVIIKAPASDIVLQTDVNSTSLDQIISIFNSHIHSGVTTGSSDTGAPTTPIP